MNWSEWQFIEKQFHSGTLYFLVIFALPAIAAINSSI
jgi:hypothetical protein